MGKAKLRATRVIATRVSEELFKVYEKASASSGLSMSTLVQKVMEANPPADSKNPMSVETWVRKLMMRLDKDPEQNPELFAKTLGFYKNVDTRTPIPEGPFMEKGAQASKDTAVCRVYIAEDPSKSFDISDELFREAERDVKALMKATGKRTPEKEPEFFKSCVQERLNELCEIDLLEKEYAGLRSQNPTLPSLEKVYAGLA